MNDFIWCSDPKCAVGQLNNIVTCIRCSQKTCFTHKTPWHTGLTCEEYEFCWSCLADFDQIRKEGNHLHDSNCKHYASFN